MKPSLETASKDLQRQFEFDVYGKRGLTLVRGRGARVWDDQGRGYIDCAAGHGAAILGHAHPRVLEAMQEQAEKLISCGGSFFNDSRALLLESMIRIAPKGLTRAFLCNSGAEAVEGAMKFARIHTGRHRFITARGGFHGRTFGAMSATFKPDFSKGCEPLVPGFTHVPFNDAAALAAAVDEDTAAVILEIVQGEGGVRPAKAGFLRVARRLCSDGGALLVLDEVQTGFGRTGRMFACEHFDLEPDILCLAKAMAGGLPMGAVVVREGLEAPRGRHGSTFGGNPLVCAAARAVIQEIEDGDLAQRAAGKGNRFVERLSSLRLEEIREIRHMGLMIGIELKRRVKPYLAALAGEGVLAMPAGSTVLRLLPPLVISEEELDEVGEKLALVLSREPQR